MICTAPPGLIVPGMAPRPMAPRTYAHVPHGSAEVGMGVPGRQVLGMGRANMGRTYSGLLPRGGEVGLAQAGAAVPGMVRQRIARKMRRQTVTPLRAAWNPAQPHAAPERSAWGVSAQGQRTERAPWGAAHGLAAANRAPWPQQAAQDAARRLPWAGQRVTTTLHLPPRRASAQPGRAIPGMAPVCAAPGRAVLLDAGSRIDTARRAPWVISRARDAADRAPWRVYTQAVQTPERSAWGASQAADAARRLPWALYQARAEVPQRAAFASARAADMPERFLFGTLRALQGGSGIVIAPGVPIVEPGQPIVIPILRVYIVSNNVSIVRVSDNLALPVISMSLSLDINSWTWGWDAQMPASAESLVSPTAMLTPVELEASVNGFSVRLLAEGISRERRFGAATIRVTGRGKSALLAAPYAPVMNYMQASAFTAQQLMADVLTANGVGIGWGVDWGLTDWPVPSGVLAFQGSWMDGVVKIAQAAGGYVHPHPTAQTLRVRPRYPLPPWQWGTLAADVVLPADAVEQESIQWVDRPLYNRLFVRGEAQGILGQVTRTGTAGDLLAPMVVDPLITHADAARQRGIAVLSDTGRKLDISLRLPVAADMGGLLEPGKVISYQDGSAIRKGIVRSVKVDASFPNVWQTIGVEAFA